MNKLNYSLLNADGLTLLHSTIFEYIAQRERWDITQTFINKPMLPQIKLPVCE